MEDTSVQDYEKVSIYYLSDENREKLLSTQRECVFNWVTREGWPMGVIMSCLWHEGRMWLTAGAHRHRVSAIRREPKCSVVVTSTGTDLGPGKTVTIKGTCQIHEDRATKDWFYPTFAKRVSIVPEAADAFAEMLDSPLRVVLEVTPEKFISYDAVKMHLHSTGKLEDSELGEPLSSDTDRLTREIERRGL